MIGLLACLFPSCCQRSLAPRSSDALPQSQRQAGSQTSGAWQVDAILFQSASWCNGSNPREASFAGAPLLSYRGEKGGKEECPMAQPTVHLAQVRRAGDLALRHVDLRHLVAWGSAPPRRSLHLGAMWGTLDSAMGYKFDFIKELRRPFPWMAMPGLKGVGGVGCLPDALYIELWRLCSSAILCSVLSRPCLSCFCPFLSYSSFCSIALLFSVFSSAPFLFVCSTR